MRNFIVLFTEKEGTSAVVRILDCFKDISIVRAERDRAWEPFNHDICGPMVRGDLRLCLEALLSKGPLDFERLNTIYTKTAYSPLLRPEAVGSIGFKMRFVPPWRNPRPILGSIGLPKLIAKFRQNQFETMLIDLCRQHEVVVFVTVRQSTIRWALSKYHREHFQFPVAAGKLRPENIGPIQVDCNKLETIVNNCERLYERKRHTIATFQKQGVRTYPLFYEDFLHDKQAFFQQLLTRLDIQIASTEIERILTNGTHFKKIHDDNIASFVVNHEEVLQRFGDRWAEI